MNSKLAELVAEHRPNVVIEGEPSDQRTRIKCDGDRCQFYTENRNYWTAVKAHDAHLVDMLTPLLGDLPEVGSEWVWEPLKPRVSDVVRVTEVRWNGDEWMVESELLKGPGKGGRYWNDLSRWVEATVLLGER